VAARPPGNDPRHPRSRLALAAYARDGRARGVAVQTLLRALDTVVAPERGGDAALDFGGAREVAGTMLIRAYYRADCAPVGATTLRLESSEWAPRRGVVSVRGRRAPVSRTAGDAAARRLPGPCRGRR
jgi:hypothetical protein